ncbi:MAG: cation diffusion facilitator family transporter [Brevinema sp.]
MANQFLSAEDPKGKALIKITLWGSIAINVAIVIAAIVIGIQTKIQSLILDGLHSFTDLFSDILLLIIFPFAYKERDEDHTYGHSRYEDILSLLIGVLIINASIPFLRNAFNIIVLNKATAPLMLNAAAWIITISTIVLKEMLYHLTRIVGQKVKSTMLMANATHHRSDMFSSLLVLISLVGVWLGYPQMDSYVAFLLGVYLLYSGLKIIWTSMHVLTDKAPMSDIHVVKKALASIEGVYGFHDLRLRQSGPYIMGDVHLELEGSLTVEEAHDILKDVQLAIRQKLPHLRYFTIHMDPYRPKKND